MYLKQFIVGAVLLISGTANSQLSGNLEFTTNKFKQAESISFGGSLQYLIYRDYWTLPGINIGAIYEMDLVNNQNYLSVPINLQMRQYFIGAHSCCGGVYLEGMAGVNIRMPAKSSDRTNASTQYLPQVSGGIGVRFPMSYDYNFRVGTMLVDGKLRPLIGFKLGYTF